MATPTVPWPRGIVRTQRDGVVWLVGDLQGVGGGSGRGGPRRVRLEEVGVGAGDSRGKEEKSDGKHLANGLKHADNTREIREEAERRRPPPRQMAAGALGSSSPLLEPTQKARTASFVCWGKSFQRASLRAGEKEYIYFFIYIFVPSL